MSTLATEVLASSVNLRSLSTNFFGPLVVGAGLAKSATSAVEKVPEGSMGLRTRWGKARRTKDAILGSGKAGDLYGYVGPGRHLIMPFSHSIEKRSYQDQTTTLDPITVECNKQLAIHAAATWRIMRDGESLYKAIYCTDDLERAVKTIAQSGLCAVLSCNDFDRGLLKQPDDLFEQVRDISAERLCEYGARLVHLDITSRARSLGQMVAECGGVQVLPVVMGEQSRIEPFHFA